MSESASTNILDCVDHLQLPVSDIEKAVEWYTTYLGFKLDWRHADQLAMLSLSTGPALMLMKSPSDSHVSFISTDGDQLAAFHFRTSDIHRLRESLLSAGTSVKNISDEGGFWFMAFIDPFGNSLGALHHKGIQK